jgi:hypothetical protein
MDAQAAAGESDDGLQEGQEAAEPVAKPEAPPEEGAEAKAKPEKAEPEPEVETLEVESLHDLAKHLGLDPSDLYKLRVPLADGEEPVTLGEWKDRVQELKRAERASKEAVSLREKAQAEGAEYQRQWHERLAFMDALAKEEEARILAADRATDWDSLRLSDPAEYAARRQEQMERQQRLEGLRQRARESVATYQRTEAQAAQDRYQQVLAKEQEALLSALPDWRDPEKAKTEKGKLIDYLTAIGFGQQEIAGLADHRAVLLARNAMLYEEMQKSRKSAQGKVQVKIGSKVITPAPRQTPDQAKDEEKREAMAKLKKSGNRADFGKVLKILGV